MSKPRSKLRRVLFWSGVAALGFVVWAAAEYAHWVFVQHRLTVIHEGQLYQSAAMPPEDLLELARRRGIDSVIDFRDTRLEGVQPEREALEAAGMRHFHVPSSLDPRPETVERFVEVLDGELADGRTVLLHCHHGEGRAVMYSALYRVEFEGWEPAAARDEMVRLPPRLRFLQKIFPSLGRMSDSNPKSRTVMEYEPTRP